MDERAKALSRQYEDVLARVKVLVDQADPEGLLGLGAPADEYDDAVAELTRRLLKGEPLDRAAIEQWFDSMYGASPVGAGALSRQLQALLLEVRAQNEHP